VDYCQPGVALIADAAHTIHPLAGQGINLGLQDVEALATEILRAGKRGVDPSQLGSMAVLGRYQRQRKAGNLGMMAAMEGFKWLFAEKSLPIRWLRNQGMRGLNDMPMVKQKIIRQAMGL
jgi:2-octaprenylphenol hydroxylase